MHYNWPLPLTCHIFQLHEETPVIIATENISGDCEIEIPCVTSPWHSHYRTPDHIITMVPSLMTSHAPNHGS